MLKQLIPTAIDAGAHAELCSINDSFRDAPGRIKPAIGRCVRLEGGGKELTARVVVEDGPTLQGEHDEGAIIRANNAMRIRQHDTVAAPMRVIHPAYVSTEAVSGNCSIALAVPTPLFTAIWLNHPEFSSNVWLIPVHQYEIGDVFKAHDGTSLSIRRDRGLTSVAMGTMPCGPVRTTGTTIEME
jgi:hypothetical protein